MKTDSSICDVILEEQFINISKLTGKTVFILNESPDLYAAYSLYHSMQYHIVLSHFMSKWNVSCYHAINGYHFSIPPY